jgi:hypothetical protein
MRAMMMLPGPVHQPTSSTLTVSAPDRTLALPPVPGGGDGLKGKVGFARWSCYNRNNRRSSGQSCRFEALPDLDEVSVLNSIYYDNITQLEKDAVDPDYIQGWAGGYLGNPKREEQRLTAAYEAGYEDGAARTLDNAASFAAKTT